MKALRRVCSQCEGDSLWEGRLSGVLMVLFHLPDFSRDPCNIREQRKTRGN